MQFYLGEKVVRENEYLSAMLRNKGAYWGGEEYESREKISWELGRRQISRASDSLLQKYHQASKLPY